MGHIKDEKSKKIKYTYIIAFFFTTQKPAILAGMCKLLRATVCWDEAAEVYVNYWEVTWSHGAGAKEWAITLFLLRPETVYGAGWEVRGNSKG